MLLLMLLENFNNDVAIVAKLLNLDSQTFYDQLKSVDPSQKHGNFILKLIKSRNIRWPEDAARVRNVLTTFIKVKRRLPVGYRDINKFRTLLELENFIEPLVNTSSKKQGGLGFDPTSLPGVEAVKTVGNHKIIKVSDPESLKKLGEGAKWCTRGSYEDCQADSYVSDYGWVFVLFVGDVPIVQWTPNYDQVMDRNDEALVDRKLCQLIGYEEFILNNADASTVCDYARDVIKGRWHEAEPVILNNSVATYEYARNVIKGRWPEAELIIISNAFTACGYACDVIKSRWPEAEPIISQDAYAAYKYAYGIIDGRWPAGEPAILTNVYVVLDYARNVIKGRWPEAESVIATDVNIAYKYACEVIKSRWPEVEPMILSSKYADKYRKFVNGS